MFELESYFTGIEHYNDAVEALVVSLAYEIKVLQANKAVPYVHQLMTNCSNLAKLLDNITKCLFKSLLDGKKAIFLLQEELDYQQILRQHKIDDSIKL